MVGGIDRKDRGCNQEMEYGEKEHRKQSELRFGASSACAFSLVRKSPEH